MVDVVPLISVADDLGSILNEQDTIQDHTDIENITDSEREDEAKITLTTRCRRKHKHHKRQVISSNILVVNTDGDEGLTDTEVVDVENDGYEEEKLMTFEDLPIHLYPITPKIVEITEDKEGKVHVKNITTNIVTEETINQSNGDNFDETGAALEEKPEFDLTDVESVEVSSVEGGGGKSDVEELEIVLQHFELGGNIEMKNDNRALTNPSDVSACRAKRKSRKSGKRKKATHLNAFLHANQEDEPTTDVDYVSADSARSASVSPLLLTRPDVHEEGVTDVEDFRDSEGEGEPKLSEVSHHPPCIMITSEHQEEMDVASGRSSCSLYYGLTDVEDLEEDGTKSNVNTLLAPLNDDNALTDVEDIEVEEESEPNRGRSIPRNGPALPSPQRRVIDIHESENGSLIKSESTQNKTGKSPTHLNVEHVDEDGGTDTEYLGVSGDEEESRRNSITPDIDMFQGSVVQVHDIIANTLLPNADSHSESSVPKYNDENRKTNGNKTISTLTVPFSNMDIVTDTEDMEVSEEEISSLLETDEYQSQDPNVFEQYEQTCSTATSGSETSLPSQHAPSENVKGGK